MLNTVNLFIALVVAAITYGTPLLSVRWAKC